MKTRFNGEVPSVTDLLMQLDMSNDKGNMIKMTKLLKKLENYGCITTKKEGRIKKINLTLIGSSLSEVLKNV
jgi:predicted transcriptional regulator